MEKIKAAILGSGNIGTDLMKKLQRSSVIELTTVIGVDPESDGLRKAREAGFHTISNGIAGFLEQPDLAEIVFDATSAYAHVGHAKILKELGKQVLDLTPAAIGPAVVPPVNLHEHLKADNVNMVTCGGQATIPIVYAISTLYDVNYAEIVATISSRSAGPGTRANIDEFTITTSKAIETVGRAEKGKAIIILNPAEPPILMRDTIHCLVDRPIENETKLIETIEQMVETVQQYVPGYRLKEKPFIEDNRVSVFIEVEGAGDYLPPYAGNLDIMTAAAVKVAEEWAKARMTV